MNTITHLLIVLGIKILGSANTGDNGLYILVGDTVDTMLQPITKQFGNTAFDVVHDFIATLLTGKKVGQTLNILLKRFIGRLFDSNDLSLKIDVDYFFHML